MSRHILSLSHEQRTAFDLDAFIAHAEVLHQHHRDTFTAPFPKAPSRWLSHDAFTPQPIAFTAQGDIDGGSRVAARSRAVPLAWWVMITRITRARRGSGHSTARV